MKRLFIMRHAKADSQYQGSDLSRPLTQEGIETQSKMAQFLRKKNYQIDGILYSPYKRAEDSAKILHQNFSNAKLFKEPALGSIFDSYTILKHLEEKSFKNLLIVGHAPTLSAFGQSLLSKPKALVFEKSAVAVFDFKNKFEFGKAELVDFYEPRNF